MTTATVLKPSPARNVYATTAPTWRATYTDADGALTSPPRVDFAITNPSTKVRSAPVTVTASSTGVFEQAPQLTVAGEWIGEWIVYNVSNEIVMTDKLKVKVV